MASNTTGNGFIAWDPHLEDHNKGKPVMVMAILFTVLITISTVLRLFMKLKTNGGLAISDYFIFIALVSFVFFFFLLLFCTIANVHIQSRYSISLPTFLRFNR